MFFAFAYLSENRDIETSGEDKSMARNNLDNKLALYFSLGSFFIGLVLIFFGLMSDSFGLFLAGCGLVIIFDYLLIRGLAAQESTKSSDRKK
jgi:hypothetical protein